MSTKVYSKYNSDTGEIGCTFSGSTEDAALNEPCIEGSWDKNFYRVVDGVATPKSAAETEKFEVDRAWADLRNSRSRLLSGTDWTQVPDAPVDAAAWAVYRQELRDLPNNTTDPREVVWPTPPS